MKLDHYHLITDDTCTTFEFVSEGPKGNIEKLVQFAHIANEYYNLAFGDKDPLTGEMADRVVTDNGDSEKVLASVVKALYLFCDYFPNVKVYATGSTTSRTRLYRMGINRYYEKASADFIMSGQTESGWEPYQKGKITLLFS